jgi:hypothetical protein
MDHWHSLGAYMLVIILLCVALLLDMQQQVMRRGLLRVALTFAVMGMMLTLTMGPILGAIAGSVGLGIASGRSRKVLAWLAVGALVIVVALGPFLGARLNQQFSDQVGQVSATAGSSFLPQTVRYRIEVWRSEYAPLVMSHVLTGYGPGLPLRQLALYRDVVRNPAPEGRSASAGHLRRLDVCSVVAGQIAGVIVPSQPGRQVHCPSRFDADPGAHTAAIHQQPLLHQHWAGSPDLDPLRSGGRCRRIRWPSGCREAGV